MFVEVSKFLLVHVIAMGTVCLFRNVLEQLLVDSEQVDFMLEIFP